MKILFVCTGNSCRSVMAKGYFEKKMEELGKTGIEALSAGIAPLAGMKATKEAIQVLSEEGVDVSNHCARNITGLAIREADLIFVMENIHKKYIVDMYPNAEKKTYLMKDFKKVGNFEVSDNPNIPDPIGKDISFYKEIFSVIKDSIERILKKI